MVVSTTRMAAPGSRRRRMAPRGVVALVAVAALVWAPSASLAAGAPGYGWWSQTTVGPLGGVTTPPDVPEDGLFIQTTLEGPLAISAVSLVSSEDLVPVTLTLTVTGGSFLSEAPHLCPTFSDITPVAGGAWADLPPHDCSRASAGVLADDGMTVAFDVAPFVAAGDPAVVIIAVGTTDRSAFEAPELTTAANRPAEPNASPTPAPSASPAAAPAPRPSSPPSPSPEPAAAGPAPAPAPASVSGGGFVPPPSGFGGSAPSFSVGVTTPAIEEPAVALAPLEPDVVAEAAPDAVAVVAAPSTSTSVAPLSVIATGGWRRDVFTMLGMAMLAGLIVFWTDGFGAIPLRAATLDRRATASARVPLT